MLDTLNHIVSVDVFTLCVVGVLSAWAALIIRHMADLTSLALLFMPVINLGALAGIFACREFEIVFSYERDLNLIVSASVGMIVALFVLLLTTRLLYMAGALSADAQLARNVFENRPMDV